MERETSVPDSFDKAVEEAVSKLRESYSNSKIDNESSGIYQICKLVTDEAANKDLRRDASKIFSMLAERFPKEVAQTVPQIIESLGTIDDAQVRKELLLALGYVSKEHPGAFDSNSDRLVDLIDSETFDTRYASWILANIGEHDPHSIEPLADEFIDLLDSEDEEVRRHAIRAIGALVSCSPETAERALPGLLDSLDSTTLYRTVGRALVEISSARGKQVSQALLNRIKEARPSVREHAAWTMVEVAKKHPGLFQEYTKDLISLVREDDDHQVMNCAVATLTTLAIENSKSDLVDELISLTKHEDMFVRRYGYLALGDIATETGHEQAIQALALARSDEVDSIERLAEKQLSAVSSEFPEVVDDIDPGFSNSPSQDG